MAMMMVCIMPARAQHPFSLTTPDDVTNHTETLYWIESNGATGFYAIAHTNNSNVSTTNMPNLKALWYFMDAGTENNTQYYYVVNHNTGYYLKLDGSNGNDNTIKIANFGSGGDAFKFSIDGIEGAWILYPKSGNGNYWVNKKSGNVAYDRYLKSSNYGGSPDENSKWNFVAKNSVTWAHPFNNSTDLVKHYYNIHNATSKGSTYYMSIDDVSDPYATVSKLDNSKRMWYFIEADSDNTIPNLKYYYIVNVATDKYLKFTGTANGSSQASSLQLFEHDGTETGETEDRFQFMVLNAKGTDYSAYSIMPKLEISYYDNQNASLSPGDANGNTYTGTGSITLYNDMKIGVYNDRGTDSNYAHWLFEDVVVVSVEAPTITNDSGTISMSTATAGATIYYTTDGNIPDNTSTEYTSPFSLGEATVIRAIAYLGSEFSYVSTYNVPSGGDYSHDYLTFKVRTGGTICWKAFGSVTKTIQYSINNGAWTALTSSSTGATISVETGDVVRFKGSNTTYATSNSAYSGFDGGTATYDVSGNIMSLIYGDNFDGKTALEGEYNFCSLFKQSKAVSAENLILPAMSLTNCCYRAMFSKCTTLEVAPALPATTLADYCYYYMFEECEITSAPELPAQTLASNCYGNMFLGCTSLNYIKCLAVNKSASGCLTNWVNNVSSTGTFVKPENVNWGHGVSGIPNGWAVNKLPNPTINCDGELITISCPISGANIFYRFGQSGNFSLYSASIAITENTLVEAYAVKDELSSATVCEDCIAIKSYKYAGLKITSGPLYYGVNGYEIMNGWNYNSYNSICGKTVGSTYFNFIELGQLFESSVFSTSDGDIDKVLDPLDGWRVPTNAEWASIFGTTRSGSTVNGSSNKHYAMIQLADASGLLVFPDGETITGAALSNMDNTTSNTGITAAQLNNYLSQGCIFLPGCGYYDSSLQTWGNENHYWSSIENDSSTGYDLCFGSSAILSDDNKDKETYYFPVYLVKGATDEATQLLRTWTYDNNEVELPYSVNAINGHSSSYTKGTFTFTTDVKVKASQPTYLWFQHADQSADIYVNGTKVATHWGGYNAFFTDITNAVMPGLNNIRVTLNNTTRNTLAPFAGDFNFNATLGEVKLISSPVVPSPDYGYDGFHITSTVTEESATITVKTSVPAEATLTCSIDGTNCNYSATQTGTGEITFTTTINNPHLWNGTLDPYLYDVTLTIAKDGVVYHTFKRGYGLRFFEYRVDNETPANSRFYLNGSPYLLRGVCMHSDLEGKANAITDEDIDNDFEILKDLGCNFVRLAHYPHPKEVYDHCDKMGIIVQTEVPWVNKAESTLPSAYYTHLEGQYRDMVNQHYNHPSIIFWGLSNETTSDDKYFAKEKINEYISIIKGLDSSRLVGYVMSHSVDDPSGYYNDPDADWFGCNIYVGWYIDKTSNNPTSRLNTRLNKTLARLSKPLAFSEYGGGGTQNCHSDDFLNTTTSGNYERHDIEYQMWLHEGHIAAIKNFPQLLFTGQWQLFDIAVSSRQEGYKVCYDGGETEFDNNELKFLNNKGLVERDHKTKKDTYYLYKAWWNQNDKFVHICGKDYKKLTGRVIKCYTNDGNSLTLFVNDVEIETKAVTNNIATFTARDFNPGDVVRVDGASTNDTFTFTGYNSNNVFTTAGNWNNATNWSGNAVPADGSDVVIMANTTVPSGCIANAGNIDLYGGALTIEDGGQLYHSNEGVNATVKKNISAYTNNNNGWYLIGYSFAENGAIAEMDNLLANEYDLYYYDEPTHYWRNYKNIANSFAEMESARGYLYANDQAVTLGLKGTLNTGNATVTLPLKYTDGIPLAGFNLVANPYAHNVTSFTGSNISSDVYRMNDTKDNVVVDNISDNNPLKPGEGFFVKALADNASITFNSGARDEMTKTGRISLEISANGKLIDRLILKQDGKPLEKFTLSDNGTKIFAMYDYQEMAVIPIEGNEQDIYFEAAKNGIYTISLSTENTSMHYLHLIDNETGDDVDLLQTPSYSFVSMTTDYANRFKLVFVCGDADDDETFAFINNGNIIITVDVENPTLQVIDVMGRVIVSRKGDISGNVSTKGMTPGTYILRLIDGDNVRTQKIVIR